MSIIQVSHLTFAYEGSYDNIFEDVSFQIDTDWKLGFIGRNGRGKTTFLNLLLRKYEYNGTISSTENFEYFPFPVEDTSQLTLHILESLNPQMELWQITKELNLMNTDPEDLLYRPFSTLSYGERTKALLACLFLKENTFLLIDEPTNHLDVQTRQKVAEYLSAKKGFILVSHDRSFLDACIDHVLAINRQNIEVQRGNFSSWYANKQSADRLEASRNENLKKDIRRLDMAAKRASRWSDKIEKTKTGTKVAGLKPDRGHIGHQAAKMMRRAKSIENRQRAAIQEKEKLLKNIETIADLKLNPLPHHSNRLIDIRDLTIFCSGRPLFSPLTLEIHAGDRVALTGPNGCGKSSILKLLMGENLSAQGELHLASNIKISYVPQDASGLKGSLSDFAESTGLDGTLFRTVLSKLGLERTQFEKNMEEFSEGQKKKVLLAKSLCEPSHLFLWDEPLNFIDIFSRIQLEELLLKFHPTMLFVEHDRTFQEKIATKSVPLFSVSAQSHN